MMVATCHHDLAEWLASGTNQHPSGAIASWVDGATGQLGYEYPEITGYALTYLSAGHGSNGGVDGAAAADWLCDRIERGDFSGRAGDGGVIYNFDHAIQAVGLMSFGETDGGSARHRHGGLTLARRLRDQLQTTGTLPAIDPRGAVTIREHTWSVSGSAHLLKCAQALLLADRLGEEGMRDAVATLQATCDWSAGRGRPDGNVVTCPGSERVHLHAAMYFIEGLWILSEAAGDQVARELADAHFSWVLDHQLANGGFPNIVGVPGGQEQNDVLAQVVRMAALLRRRDERVTAATERLVSGAVATRTGAAIRYRPDDPQVHLNSRCTMFADQALGVVSGEDKCEWYALV